MASRWWLYTSRLPKGERGDQGSALTFNEFPFTHRLCTSLPRLDEELFFFSGAWDGSGTVWTSVETQRLHKELRGWAAKSKAGSTFKKYRTPWKRWVTWAVERTRGGEHTPIIPADPLHLALHLTKLAEEHPTATSVVETAVTALNTIHRVNGAPEPYSYLSKVVNDGVRRARGKSKKKAKPLTTEIIRKIASEWGHEGAPLWQNMMATLITVGFATFCRVTELFALTREDVTFEKDLMRVFIEESKTDQFRHGAWILVARTRTSLCPVLMMVKYLERLNPESGEPLFRTIWRRTLRTEGQESLGTLAMYSSIYHKYFRQGLMELAGVSEAEAQLYSGHSMRRGGATAAALGRVPDHLRMSHGRWVSQATADGYIGVLQRDAMQLTLSLGL